jgi:hypothetical protein
MRRVWGLVAAAAIVVATLLTGWVSLARGADTKEQAPIVSAVAVEWRTTYETDTFEQDRLRDSTTTVTRVLLVRQDGSVESKKVR